MAETYMDDPEVQRWVKESNDDVLEIASYIGQRPEPLAPRPFILRWKKLAPLLDALSRSTKGEGGTAGGRVVSLLNRTTGPWKGSTTTMLAELRVLSPKQRTKPHRHSMAAVQYVVEGRGESLIDGERFQWEKGDVLAYPAWSVHELANTEESPLVLMNVLDAPLVEGMGFLEVEGPPAGPPEEPSRMTSRAYYPESVWEQIRKAEKGNLSFLTFFDTVKKAPRIDPVLARWKDVHPILQSMMAACGPDSPRAGEVLFVNNRTTGELQGTTPTMCAGYQAIPPGKRGPAHIHTAANVLMMVEGKGYLTIDGVRMDWEAGDIVVHPGILWHEQGNRDPKEPAIFYGVSDITLLSAMRIMQVKPFEGKFQRVVSEK